MNILRGSRCYLAGPIDHCENDGIPWRRDMTKFLREMGVTVLDPTDQPADKWGGDFAEIADEKERLRQLQAEGKYDQLREACKRMRNRDLRMTDIADYIIALIDLKIPMCGTWEEIFNANRQKKPILVMVANGGVTVAPRWLFGTIPWQYMFSSFADIKKYLEEINNGGHRPGSRWNLLDLVTHESS